MSNKITASQKQEYISLLNAMLKTARHSRICLRIGIGCNSVLALYLLGLAIHNKFFTPEPNRVWIFMTCALCIMNLLSANSGLKELERNKKFVEERKKELEAVSAMETEE
jgi:hypothetical protein